MSVEDIARGQGTSSHNPSHYISTDKPLLGVCDNLRNETLVDLGVRLEDKDGTSIVKHVGKEAILREKEQEKQVFPMGRCIN